MKFELVSNRNGERVQGWWDFGELSRAGEASELTERAEQGA